MWRGAVVAALLLCVVFPGAARAQDAQAQERDRPLLVQGRHGEPADEPSALPLPDEQKIERARNLVRMGYAAQAQALVDDVALRHPDDLDVLLARAELASRTADAATLARSFDDAAQRPGVQRQLATRPRRAGTWHRYHAEALFALGRPADATRAVLAAWEASPDQAAWARIRLDDARAADASAVTSAASELRKVADRHPEREDLALAAAQQEARSGQMRAAVKRVQRLDATDADGKRGGALWRFGLSFLERGEGVAALALDPAADPALRAQATDRLFDDADASLVPPTPSVVMPGATTSTITRLTVDAQGHLVVDHSGGMNDLFKGAKRPSPADAGQVAARAGSLAGLERVWRGLPPSRETVRRGLDLSERMRSAGDLAGAARVEDATTAMAKDLAPGAGAGGATAGGAADAADPELDARLALREGESALTAGDLAGAATAFQKVAGSNASDRVKEQAEFEACETAFYAGQFDSAAAGYDRFARAHPAGPFTNDALARAYLVESGDGGPVPGLAELAKAMRLARSGAGDDVIAAASAAEKASANGPAWAETELLLANLLEARGLKADAVAKAVGLADARPDDRLAPAARKKAGDLYHAMGQDALALAQYDLLLTKYPRSWLAPETRRVANGLRAKAGANP